MIYLDNAATTLRKPPEVAQAVLAAMQTLGNSGRSAHGGSLDASRTLYDARCALAELFHAPAPERVCFTANATEALNIAVCGLLGPGDHIISTDCEHNSVLRPLYRLRAEGASVDFLPADRLGRLDPDDLPRLLRPETRALVVTAGSNVTGNLTDLRPFSAFAAEHGLFLIVDASQTAGVIPIDMQELKISALCFTGHKSLMGPQGTGGVAVCAGVEIRPWCVGGTGVQTYLEQQPEQYPTRLEAGTRNAHGVAGLLAALRFLQKTGLPAVSAHEQSLMRRFHAGVRDIPGVTVYGDFSAPVRAPIV